MSKISVIIPIYNVEKYLEKCLKSVINQTYKDLEIICVDDCSPDNSNKIVQEYLKKDSRIKLIKREKNGGISAARNSGLKITTGEYIYFLDSDDWIDLDYLEKMVSAIKENNVDVVLNTKIVKEEERKQNVQFLPNLCPQSLENKFLNTQDCVWKLVWNVWAYLWKKSALDKIDAKFPEGYINEDMYFQSIVLSSLDKIYVIRNSSYHYLIRKNSISDDLKSKRSREVFNILKILNKTADYYFKKGILNFVNIKLFVLITIFDCDDKELVFEELRKYFLRIKENVEKNKNLYDEVELEMFNDVLNDKKKVLITNYYKKYLFYSIRKGLNIKNV